MREGHGLFHMGRPQLHVLQRIQEDGQVGFLSRYPRSVEGSQCPRHPLAELEVVALVKWPRFQTGACDEER